MPLQWIVTSVALAVICAVLIYVLFASRRRWKTRLAQQELQTTERVQCLRSFTDRLRTEHRESLTAAQESSEATLERIREWVASGMRWEGASRNAIIDVATKSGLDGFLATNICFQVNGEHGTYIHQIDHLLVTSQKLMVIEAKNWSGIIFHFEHGAGVPVQSSFERLEQLKQLPRRTPYVVHMREEHKPTILVDSKEPTRQVFRQTMKLKETLLAAGMISTSEHFETCVFYSHPNSILVTESNRIGKTHVVDEQGMAALFTPPHRFSQRTSVIEDLANWTTKHGADLYGLGKYQDKWVSIFPR